MLGLRKARAEVTEAVSDAGRQVTAGVVLAVLIGTAALILAVIALVSNDS
jgi:hypothetical protein